MRRAALLSLLLVLLAGCSSAPSTYIVMKSAKYNPVELHVAAGATVTWVNEDATTHTVTSDLATGPLDSGPILGGGSFRHTFTVAGRFDYHCEPHSSDRNGTWIGQVGAIVVA